ncbi:MAG: aspartate/glutamate racemase family protein [Candidatus Sabulitectum sp.]|nr:aspartate/glutamate racemase family protein [Candidatus Sabulitectum sp.]
MQQFETRIGIFDSGIGGFSILREIMGKVPSVEIDYISDDAFAPYGEKSDSDITRRSQLITKMLLDRGCSLIVVACNSATAAAIAALRQEHREIPFVGVEPYINVLNHNNQFPGIRKAAVITTELTGNSQKFKVLKQRIDPTGSILHVSMPRLASIIENILERGLDLELMNDLRKELEPLRCLELSHLILGCTHYPLIAGLIEEELNLATVSPGPYVANRVMDILSVSGEEHCTSFSYLSTNSMNWEKKGTDYLNSLLKYSRPGIKPSLD